MLLQFFLSVHMATQLFGNYDVNGYGLVTSGVIFCDYGDKTWHGMARLDLFGRFIPIPESRLLNDFTWYPDLYRMSEPQLPVYRYSSGRLIPGVMKERLGFAPKIGGTIINIKTYMSSKTFTINHNIPRLVSRDYMPPEGMEIYNLPGFFLDSKTAYRIRGTKTESHLFLPFPKQPQTHTVPLDRSTKEYTFVAEKTNRTFVERLGKLGSVRLVR